ncbi:hypothetical protein Hdeb2414_s0012g00381301 [Helianthus debilis subsp. tardiflorus]
MVGRNRNGRRARSGPPSDPPPLQHTSSPFFYSNRWCSVPIMIIRLTSVSNHKFFYFRCGYSISQVFDYVLFCLIFLGALLLMFK